MFRDKKSCFLLVQLSIVFVCKAETDYFDSSTIWSDKEYVDPHSFYYDKSTRTESLPQTDNDDHRIGEYTGTDEQSCKAELNRCRARKMSSNDDIPDEILSRRFVSMLLNRAILKKENLIFIGHIDLEATESQLKTLREFGAGGLSLREIDPILNNVLKAPDVNRIYETVLWMQTFTTEFWNYMSYHKEIIIGIATVLYLYWTLRKVKWTFWKILSIGIPIILIASFFITWWRLIEDVRIKHVVLQVKHMQMPTQCQPDKMGWMDKIRAWFYTDDCEKYYEGIMKNPDLQVTPGQALTHMVAHMLYEPIQLSGKTIAMFLNDVTKNMPWWLSYPVQVVVCIGFIPAIIFSVILLAGGSLKLGFGPFSFFSLRGPGQSEGRQNQSHESKIDRRPIENIPNVTVNVHIQDSGRVQITSLDRSHNLAITGNANPERSDQSNNLLVRDNSNPGRSNESNSLSIAKNSETSNEHRQNEQPKNNKKTNTSPVKVIRITNSDLASGDAISTHKSESTKKPVDTKVADTVPESTKLESGSGDN